MVSGKIANLLRRKRRAGSSPAPSANFDTPVNLEFIRMRGELAKEDHGKTKDSWIRA